MNWLKRHLNWSFILGLLAISLLTLGVMPLHLVLGESGATIWFFFLVLGVPVMIIALSVWLLKEKGRNLAHLLWLLIGGWGFIILLALKSKEEIELKS